MHEMIICKEGMFKPSELNWTVVEKEALTIIKACHDFDNLLMRPRGFWLYCDHANLAFILAPGTELKKHVRGRLQCWEMRLCGLRYTTERILGDKNVWADIISRWHARESVCVAAIQTRSHQVAPVEALSRLRQFGDSGLVLPTCHYI
ncbi:hypothetical protein PHMEG_00023962 [Phytophthora megakarya]|uniref:Reverse transcriptase RNase H-like domain-containing protein n=1 Tax=Phytophthora megakarya TaxID=4795 RepID=A0A225VHB4_9STRA|nr:hypothetical protein PHMEG_00023962 [Phytophthora megakarya]